MLILLVVLYAILYVAELVPLVWLLIFGFVGCTRIVRYLRTVFSARRKPPRGNRETRRRLGDYEPTHRPRDQSTTPNATEDNVPTREIVHDPPGYEDEVLPVIPGVALDDHPCKDLEDDCDSHGPTGAEMKNAIEGLIFWAILILSLISMFVE